MSYYPCKNRINIFTCGNKVIAFALLLFFAATLFNTAFAQKKGKKVYDYSTGQPIPDTPFNLDSTGTYQSSSSFQVERTFPRLVFEVGFGAGMSLGSELKEVFEFGNGLDIALAFNLLPDNKLFFAPCFHFNVLNNYYDFATQDNLFWWGFGARTDYYLFDRGKSKWNVYPSAAVKYNRINNYISPREGYAGDIINVLRGGGMSYTFGIGIERKLTFLRIDYNFFNPMTKLDKDLINQLSGSSGLYAPYTFKDTRMNFNYLNFTFGTHLPFFNR
ncbi:MAG TPA: hypothetical protein PK239_00890 [Chitinophagales bacterium]|nr:hypothetical protein [Chitinophagales bacterium]HRK25819.1 hypothetical protein [Chitinophagales bacterium]